MKKIASILIAGVAVLGIAHAEVEKPKSVSFSFDGPLGGFDKAQLQRGYKVYKEVCSGCHAMKYVAFRNLADHGGPGFTEAQVKALAASFKIHDVNDKGEGVDRAGLPSDYFPSPFATPDAAAAALGAAPPDLSLLTKAREGGAAYVYSVLTGYENPPAGVTPLEGKFYNPYFQNGPWISMPTNGNLTDGAVAFDDGAPNKVDDMARDVSAFLTWAAEPKMEDRKQTGFEVMIYLALLAGLLYALKRKVWAGIH